MCSRVDRGSEGQADERQQNPDDGHEFARTLQCTLLPLRRPASAMAQMREVAQPTAESLDC